MLHAQIRARHSMHVDPQLKRSDDSVHIRLSTQIFRNEIHLKSSHTLV